MTNKNGLAVIKNYALAEIDIKDFMESMQENIGSDGISAYDLQRIKLPSGETEVFGVPTLEGTDYKKSIEGIIIFQKAQNAFWAEEYDGSNVPPDCQADDGVHGIGDPGGLCATCPLNEFGSGPKGNGKACKNMKATFIVTQDNMLPFALTIPPTSLGNLKSYFLKLASNGKVYWKVKTRLTLEKASSGTGITYMKVVPTFLEVLSSADVDRLKVYRDAIVPMLDEVPVSAESYYPSEEVPAEEK